MSRHLTFEHHADLAGWTAEHAGQSNIDMQWSGAIRAICFIGACFASWGGRYWGVLRDLLIGRFTSAGHRHRLVCIQRPVFQEYAEFGRQNPGRM